MNSKNILIGLLLALIAAGGVYLGQRSSSEKAGAESKQSTPSDTSKKEGPQLKAASSGDDPSKKSPEGPSSSSQGSAPTSGDDNAAQTKKRIYNEDPYNVNTMPTGSRNFELHGSEQTNVILQILKYAGIIIEDPQIVQDAAQQVAINEQNEKI